MDVVLPRILKVIATVAVIGILIVLCVKVCSVYEEHMDTKQSNLKDDMLTTANKVILNLNDKTVGGKMLMANLLPISYQYTIAYKMRGQNEYIIFGKYLNALDIEENNGKHTTTELPEVVPYLAEDNRDTSKIISVEPLLNFDNKYYDNKQYYIRSDIMYRTYVIENKIHDPVILVIEEQ